MTHTAEHKGPQKRDDYFSTKKDMWKKSFVSLKTLCKEPKLKEFQFKFIHRIIATKRELFRYGIQSDDDCVYCGEQDSIEHTFSDCPFVKKFFHMRSLVGSMLRTKHTSIRPWKRNCSVFPLTI